MTTRIVRVGNTLTVEIPEDLVAQASLPVGEPVEWVANGTGSIALVSPDSWEHRHIRAGLADLDAGRKVSNERVTEWLDSWGTENELPAQNEDLVVFGSDRRPGVDPRLHCQR